MTYDLNKSSSLGYTLLWSGLESRQERRLLGPPKSGGLKTRIPQGWYSTDLDRVLICTIPSWEFLQKKKCFLEKAERAQKMDMDSLLPAWSQTNRRNMGQLGLFLLSSTVVVLFQIWRTEEKKLIIASTGLKKRELQVSNTNRWIHTVIPKL